MEEKTYVVKYNKEKQDKLLGMKMRTRDETTKDILEYYAKQGW